MTVRVRCADCHRPASAFMVVEVIEDQLLHEREVCRRCYHRRERAFAKREGVKPRPWAPHYKVKR